jgi:hypothetical protein
MDTHYKFPASRLKTDQFFLHWLAQPENQELVSPHGVHALLVCSSSFLLRTARRQLRAPCRCGSWWKTAKQAGP